MRSIKDLREENGYTQERFAELLNVSVHTVRSWEQGQRFPGRRSKKDIGNLLPTLTVEEVDNLFNEEVL